MTAESTLPLTDCGVFLSPDIEFEEDKLDKRSAGRTAVYDEVLVRDVSEQVAIAFYNSRPELLAAKILEEPKFVAGIRERAQKSDSVARAWLKTLDTVAEDHPDRQRELMFWSWCAMLEPAHAPGDSPEREADLRQIRIKYCTDWEWDTNCKRWVEAINRVRIGNLMTIDIPKRQKKVTQTARAA